MHPWKNVFQVYCVMIFIKQIRWVTLRIIFCWFVKKENIRAGKMSDVNCRCRCYLLLSAVFQVSITTMSWIGLFQGIMYIQKVLYICYHFSIPLVRSPLTFALYFLKYQLLSSKVIFHTFSNDLQFWGVKSACICVIV